MVKQQTAIFRSARPSPPAWVLHFELEQPPKAGAYLLADLGGPLREALFPVAAPYPDSGAGSGQVGAFRTLVPPGHPATQLLPGARVDVLGPLGRGFRLHDVQRLLLVTEAGALPFMRPLISAAASVTVVVEAATRLQLPAPATFPPHVELALCTRDGSAGYQGPLESAPASDEMGENALPPITPHLRELLAWAERVCLACDPARYAAVAALVYQARFQPQPDFAQALVRVRMPCGVGACEVCRVKTPHGELRACTDGPVFDLLQFAETGPRYS